MAIITLEAGLANFKPKESNIIRKASPEGHICVYIHRKREGGGVEGREGVMN